MNAAGLINGLGLTLLHFLWQGASIAVLFYGISALIPAVASRQRYCVGCLALLAMAIAPMVTLQRVAIPAPPPADSSTRWENPALKNGQPASTLEKEQPVMVAAHFTQPVPTLKERLQYCLPWVVLLWSVGLVALGARWLAGWRQIHRLRRTGLSELGGTWPEQLKTFSARLRLNRPVCLAQSAWAEVPLVIGWLRPMILLPASCMSGLAPEQLESILAHELAHIARHDYLVNLLQCGLETLLFYHPAVWAVSRRVRLERENCCDDLAVELCGNRLVYARALATLEEMRSVPMPLVLAVNDAPLLVRIRRLLSEPPPFRPSPIWPLLLFAGLICISLFLLPASKGRGANLAIPPTTNSVVSLAGPQPDPMQHYYTNNNAVLVELKVFALKESPFKLINDGVSQSALGTSGLLTMSQAADAINLMRKSSGVSESTALTKLGMRADPLLFRLVAFPPGSDTAPKGLSSEAGNTLVYVTPKVAASGLIDLYLQATVFPTIGNQPIDSFKMQVTVSNGMTTCLAVSRTNQPDLLFFATATITNNIVETGHNDVFGLETRTFHFDTNAFLALLGKSNDTNTPISELIRGYFIKAGVDMDTNNPANLGKLFVFNSKKGSLLVKLPPNDLKKVEDSIAAMDQPINFTGPPTKTNLSGSDSSQFNITYFNYDGSVYTTTNPIPLETRQFILSPKLTAELEVKRGKTNFNAIYDFLATLGADFYIDNPANRKKMVAYSFGHDRLLLRSTAKELDLVERNLALVNFENPGLTNKLSSNSKNSLAATAGQVDIKVHFMEVDESKNQTFNWETFFSNNAVRLTQQAVAPMAPEPANGLTNFNQPTNAVTVQFTGFLTSQKFKLIQSKLKHAENVLEVAAPEVVTESVRQAQMQLVELKIVYTSVNSTRDEQGHVHNDYQTQNLPFGTICDVVPTILPDSSQVKLKLDMVETEFLGYSGKGALQKEFTDARALVPHPQYGIRKLSNDVTVGDGQTLVMIGVASDRAPVLITSDSALAKIPWLGRLFRPAAVKPPRKIMMVFVTVSIINPDGTLKYPANHLN